MSLSRVLSPFRVQTKIEENSLPVRSNVVPIRRIVEMTFYCVVLTYPLPDPFPVNIFQDNSISENETIPKAELTFGHLKQMIVRVMEKSPNVYKNICEVKSLWKVKGLAEGDDKWTILEEIANDKDETSIERKLRALGNKLKSSMSVDHEFPNFVIPKEQVHIVVQPPTPATTGKRRWGLNDGNEDRDRKKIPETIHTRAQKIMKSIMELPENPETYSNPKRFLSLPFPFLGSDKPVDRFSINNDGKFWYMGRKAFDDVLDMINGLILGYGYKKCFIYGTMGYGKSYILATIVCFLFRNGKRVVYLPDCHELAMNTKDYVKSALYLAYENNSDKINKIHACETLDQIVEFCKEESEPLYIVVDQMNALDGHNDTEINESVKQRTIEFLSQMATNHYYIKSSSANNQSALRLKLQQTNEKRIELYGGFDEDEMLQWWIKNSSNFPSMDDEQKKKIEYITGRNPLFLSFLLGSERNYEDALNHLNPILTEKIKLQMTNFSDMIKSGRGDIHVKLMSSCLTNGYAPSGYGIDDYDHRFFYIDKNERCHYTSGFVRDCMANYLFEKGKLEVFATSSWIQCIKEFGNNPSVKGFMVEKACLSSIYRNGFMADEINFKCDNYKFFTSIKEIDFSTNEGLCTFYLPRLWNQKSIDGLITSYKKKKVEEDTLYIVPIQITLDKETHSDSEASFFAGIWPELKSKIKGDLKVELIFIWITRENDIDYFVEANEKILKQRRKIEINPQYMSIVKSFRCVNTELENILSC